MTSPSAMPERTAIEVPLGSRILVRSGLFLDVSATPTTTQVTDGLAGELDRWQGGGVFALTGQLFASLDASSNVRAVLAAHKTLNDAIVRFLDAPGRTVYVVTGSTNATLPDDSIATFAELGVVVVSSLDATCITATGTKRVLIDSATAPVSELPDGEVSRPWLEGIDRLENPGAARQFVSSRVLYRRLRYFLWIPPLVAIVVGVLSHIAFVRRHLVHLGKARTHRAIVRFIDAPWHLRFVWVVIAIIVAELIVAIIATLIARHIFASSNVAASVAQRGTVTTDEVAGLLAAEQSDLDIARAFTSHGGTGVIMGGSMTASLTHLDNGFLAVPGASSLIVREHHGRFGLPPLFLDHLQESQFILETGAELHVRLEFFDNEQLPPLRIERAIASDPVTPLPPHEQGLRVIASWPTGGAWPPPVDLSTNQQRARRIRRLAAVSLFATGLLDILLAVAPPLRSRIHTVLTYLPLGVSQTAAAGVVFIGIALIMLSRGILRGQRRSWIVAVILLGISTALHVAHAASIGAVLLTAAVLVLLIVERRYFQGTTDRGSLKSALPLLVLIVVVAVFTAFFAVEISYHHLGELPSWPLVLAAVIERLVGLSTIALPDRADDFVYPTMLAVGVGVLITILYLVTRPVVDRRLSQGQSNRDRNEAQRRARSIVERYGKGTLDYFALRDDKQYFFYGDSLVAYAVYGGIALVSPDPIGPESERTQVWGAFRAFCDAHGWSPGLIGASAEWLPIYDESGMRWLYLGDEAVVDVQHFTLEGKKMKGLRQAVSRLANKGYTVEFLDPATIDPARVPALVELMGMNRRGEDERGFSMMLGRLFDPKDTGLLLTVVSGPDGAPAAMCQFVPSPAINGYSLDLMRRDPSEHPNGLLDFALCSTVAHLKAQGVSGLSLNFSAFRSTLDGEKGDGVTQRIERWGLRRLSSILPIETLWKFNEKYKPNWLARHLVYAAPEFFVPTVAAALRAESITEIPVLGRFLAQDPANRPGTVVPPELLEGQAPPR